MVSYRLNLKWKLAISVTALSIALIAIVSGLQMQLLKQEFGADIAAQQYRFVTHVAHELDNQLNASLTALERAASALPPATLDEPSALREHLASRSELLVFFDDLLLFSPDGRLRADYPYLRERASVDASDRRYFRQALATKRPVISEPLRARGLEQPVVVMAVPIVAADGRVKAVFMGTIRLLRDNFLGDLASSPIGRDGYFFLLTRGDKPIYVIHPDRNRILAERPANATPSTTRALAGFEGSVEDTNSHGLRMLLSYRQLRSTGWLLTGALPVEEAYAPIAAAERRTVWIAAAIALLVAPLVWLCAWRLFEPLTRLLNAINASRSAQQAGEATALRRGENELDVLLRAFDELMAERERAEQRLRDSEQRIRAITDNVPALVCYIEPDHRFTFNNHGYEKWLQKPLSEITGQRVVDVYGDATYADLRPHLCRALAGEATRFDVQFPGRDGRVHSARGVYRPDFDADGLVRGVYGLITDVTHQRSTEDSLRDERTRLAAIIEGTNAGTWEWDLRSGESRVNERWAEVLGHSIEELGTVTIDTWASRVHPDDRQRIRFDLKEHLAGRSGHHEFEARMRHKDGSWVWMLGYGRVSDRDTDGRALVMRGVHLDISARKAAEDGLRVSQQFLERTGKLAGVGGWDLRLADNALTWSEETCRLHDLPHGHRPTLDEALAFYRPDARVPIRNAVRDAIEHGTSWDLELGLVSAAGRPFWARTVGAVEYEDGVAVRLVGAFQDVTARKAIEQELAENRQLLQTTLDSIGDAVITTDPDGAIRWLNPVAERMTGWSGSEAKGRPLAQVFVVIDEETRLAAGDPVAACIADGKGVGASLRLLLLSRNGQEFGIEDSASPIRDADERVLGVVLVFRDVSEQRRLTHEMTHRATHDPLTGLVNRAEFETRLHRLALSFESDQRASSLLYIDLDRFKLVNDSCGHAIGDLLLQQVSTMIRQCVRSRDTVARLGGDEFGVILEHCDVTHAQRIAQKMCDDMEAFRFLHDGQRFRVGTSIGLVPFDSRWTSLGAAVQAADASCYAAKAAGRNRVHVWVASDDALARHDELQWVARLEQAIDENRFELYGQRIAPIGVDEGGLHCEVLLRLRNADGTLALPGAFLPAAERFHLATRIDRWVMREVFAWLSVTADVATDVEMIAINLSGRSIADRAFHRDVIAMIRAADFDVRKLCFEITETVAVTNFVDAKLFIDDVRRMGVKIALDDFGAGASSFGYLKSLPVDFLKIDGQFITGLLDNALDDAAVRCFREVATVVGVKTIAEFVERTDVHDLLRSIGIDMAQGYLIHRPEPLAALTAAMP